MAKIEARILEQDIRIKKEQIKETTISGHITIGFNCPKCRSYQRFTENFPNNGTDYIQKCDSCDEEYLIEGRVGSLISFKIGDKEDVDTYREMIPTLQKHRGILPEDKINLQQ